VYIQTACQNIFAIKFILMFMDMYYFLSESTEGCNGLSGLFDEKRYSVGYTEACDL